MIQEPAIDKLVKITGCKFALVCGISKRARQIIEQPHTQTEHNRMRKPISAAAYEIYEQYVILEDN